ncbi:Rieske (2Fe-2S) protein [Mucilaginibacter lappiensis]|uniref:Nitrite reductase (NADH) small subunit/3-phenylpropionate/trans-cinnamate dioxygenase ferredoxin subunit n=1 Tax=Mucilaginibacter lappiensis TaxID=354630 RepID=A0A841JI19_9SPHI|nr:Rieske (2Fe-2S) protein [Mucilaginibacter lappiensis]MBB6127651.1 nitrite reductase (NADH) small subunit/3-phenylpropionate/trans-cinnamate dioxygenase ferredoxin subunit [Mucilaginibacter lappiensis]
MRWYKTELSSYGDKPFIKKVKIGGKSICLVGFEGAVYALSAICPHAGADLSEGLCVKGKIVCPYHRYTYNLETGKGGEGRSDFVTTYPVDIRDDGIYVGVKSFWDRLSGK